MTETAAITEEELSYLSRMRLREFPLYEESDRVQAEIYDDKILI